MAKHMDKTVAQVQQALAGVMAVRIDALERLVQEAHESAAKEKDDPPERFPVSRQCLRMLWHFRCNLEAVMPKEPSA